MVPEPGNPQEAEGVLNPAAVRGPDGQLYLFPRLVARGDYSRIGIARVKFDRSGDPCAVERLGIALEPQADYERRADGGGGCEDPRITFIEPLQRYIMTYAALSSVGPRIALAISSDLFHWQRLGLAIFAPYRGIDFVHVDNKDACLFPLRFPITQGRCRWVCCTDRFFQAAVPRTSHAWIRRGPSISTRKASGFHAARCPQQALDGALWGSSIPTIAWPRRRHRGSS